MMLVVRPFVAMNVPRRDAKGVFVLRRDSDCDYGETPCVLRHIEVAIASRQRDETR